MLTDNKFHLYCKKCKYTTADFGEWFFNGQKCPVCQSVESEVIYHKPMNELKNLVYSSDFHPRSMWDYFDFLPLNHRENIVSVGEGVVPIDRWSFLEEYAKGRFNLNVKVYAARNDNNYSTGTFKDLAGSMVASVLKENKIENYVVASTGNIATAFSRYLGSAGISVYAFIPQISIKSQEAEIGCYGQRVFRVNGDYHRAKQLAREFADKYKFQLAAGNFDPMRVEAKKTMVYEWLRLLPEFPTVYIQALSGGSGPIGIAKACDELADLQLFDKMPRFILPQPHNCAPMAHAWAEAKANNFPDGWQVRYPVYNDPVTEIQTLSTGNPTAYPSLSQIVKRSNGDIISVNEHKTIDISRLVAYEVAVKIGPAAAIAVGGFFNSLHNNLLHDGDVVMVNIGEGVRRSPDFMEKLIYTTQHVNTLKDCVPVSRQSFRTALWEAVESI